jgi:hypothetical protein
VKKKPSKKVPKIKRRRFIIRSFAVVHAQKNTPAIGLTGLVA